MREVFGFIRRSLDKEAVKQYLKEREEQFTNIDEDAYDLIAAMTDTKQLQMVKDKYRSEEGGINMCKGLLDWVEESKIEGKSAGELTILKLITAMQLDGRTGIPLWILSWCSRAMIVNDVPIATLFTPSRKRCIFFLFCTPQLSFCDFPVSLVSWL